MKVIIAGGRDIKPSIQNINWLVKKIGIEVTEVVCGMQRGVDIAGKAWGDFHGIHVEPFPANWTKYGNPAGPIRNKQMAEYADALILIWDGRSRGSSSMLSLANSHKLDVYQHIVVSP